MVNQTWNIVALVFCIISLTSSVGLLIYYCFPVACEGAVTASRWPTSGVNFSVPWRKQTSSRYVDRYATDPDLRASRPSVPASLALEATSHALRISRSSPRYGVLADRVRRRWTSPPRGEWRYPKTAADCQAILHPRDHRSSRWTWHARCTTKECRHRHRREPWKWPRLPGRQ